MLLTQLMTSNLFTGELKFATGYCKNKGRIMTAFFLPLRNYCKDALFALPFFLEHFHNMCKYVHVITKVDFIT